MRLAHAVLPALWLAAVAPAQAAPPPGAASCTGCHPRAAGRGPVPSLTGRAAEDIVGRMDDFRTGERQSTVMVRIARGFSDEEIRAIADWFAAGADPNAARRPQP